MSAQQEHRKGFRGPFSLLGLVGLGISISGTAAAQAKMVPIPVDLPSSYWSSLPTGHLNPKQVLHLTVCLDPADKAGLEAAVNDVSNPKSANYRHWMTPKQIGAKFGQTTAKVNSVVSYLKSKGLTVNLVADNRFSILTSGTVAQVEKAFSTTINNYHALNEMSADRANYFSFTGALKVPDNIASVVTHVSGVQNHDKPVHFDTLTPAQTRTLYNIAPIYDALFKGAGRTIGITDFDGFELSNIPLFYSTFNLTVPAGGLLSNVRVITLDTVPSLIRGEGDLDNQMPFISAPLANLIIYSSGNWDQLAVLTREANDNLADVLSESYGFLYSSTSSDEAGHTLHLAMSLQGMTYLAASGDSGTGNFVSGGQAPYPAIDPEVLTVGGTIATVDVLGNRLAEVAWSLGLQGDGGGGGYCSRATSFNHLPVYQVGTGVPTDIDRRLIPDVSLQASSLNDTFASYWFFQGGSQTTASGTSFSSPVCAGALAVVEEKLIAAGKLTSFNGKMRLGRVQDVLYALNGNSSVFFDITSGDIGPLDNGQEATAHAGWDFATGWGSINFDGLATALGVTLITATDNASSAGIWGGKGDVTTGSVANLVDADGSDFTVSSVAERGLGNIAAAEIDFSTTQAAANVFRLSANLVLSSQPRGTTNYLYAFNVGTAKWDLLKTTAYKAADVTVDVELKASKYVASDNSVKLMVRSVVPTRLVTSPFTLGVDQAKLTEVYIAP